MLRFNDAIQLLSKCGADEHGPRIVDIVFL